MRLVNSNKLNTLSFDFTYKIKQAYKYIVLTLPSFLRIYCPDIMRFQPIFGYHSRFPGPGPSHDKVHWCCSGRVPQLIDSCCVIGAVSHSLKKETANVYSTSHSTSKHNLSVKKINQQPEYLLPGHGRSAVECVYIAIFCISNLRAILNIQCILKPL